MIVGTGEETIRTGHMTARTTCSYCDGSKIFIKFKCLECEGLGRKTYDTGVPLTIPPGTVNGEVFRLELDPADLNMCDNSSKVIWVTVSVGESEQYSLVDRDLETSVEISPAMAVLGGTTLVQTPARRVPVMIAPGCDSGRVQVVAEEGLRTGDSLPGDLRVRTAVRTPTQLTWRQRRVWRRFAELESSETDKLVDNVEHHHDHKLRVNVVEADKVFNSVVKQDKVDPMQKTITETIRDKLGLRPAPRQERPQYAAGYHRMFRF